MGLSMRNAVGKARSWQYTEILWERRQKWKWRGNRNGNVRLKMKSRDLQPYKQSPFQKLNIEFKLLIFVMLLLSAGSLSNSQP